MVGGHDARAHHRHVVHPAAGEHVLEDHLLLQNLQLGRGDVLLARLHLGFRLNDVDGSDGPQLRAALVVLVQFLVQFVVCCFTLRSSLSVTRSSKGSPVGHGGHHLVLESEVGNVPLVPGYPNARC